MQPFEVSAPHPQGQVQVQYGYPMYNQGVSDAKGVAQRNMIAMQMRNNMNAPGKGLVILFGLVAIVGSLAAAYIISQASYYRALYEYYRNFSGSSFSPEQIFNMTGNSCKAYLIGSLGVPAFLVLFALFNLFATCIACCGTSCCLFFQALMALLWGGLAAYLSQQSCAGFSAFTSFFGSGNVPQNAWPYYAGMAGASLLACLLNYLWSSNRDKAESDQRNLALMMAAS